ncbi:MAG: DNA gyrase inhibitor YacG [Rhodospirillales bacterium]|nr:DNA gyrase inhibitor YacG [Rhodospirillales bacterium]MBT4040944.1 DNA gyrase inhibitor YacG [Rhodospirillales bacterium]MBT4628121.1 DNA gyrase inhibitor YacG [Rhodospirillales bacterium]MBT5350306.1 DNA gyrase inhibitor YacG [Rhodospirillales bacterium]MBT6111399.1 DNA gyrase inhibitor YacG [Rhodospirillales bacterium]
MEDDDPKVVPIKLRKCARCEKPVVHEFRPFCSRRCANLDLGNWFDETYRVPVEDADGLDDALNDEDLDAT